MIPKITDADRLAWLVAHLTYMEHDEKAYRGRSGGYWPQLADSSAAVEALVDLPFLDYIDAMIEASCPTCKGTGDTGSGYLDCPHCDAAARRAG